MGFNSGLKGLTSMYSVSNRKRTQDVSVGKNNSLIVYIESDIVHKYTWEGGGAVG
jgi:hypothetical protein